MAAPVGLAGAELVHTIRLGMRPGFIYPYLLNDTF
jgi:hypothetical protein